MDPFKAEEELAFIKEGIANIISKYDEKYWREHDKKAEFPGEYFRDLANNGYFAINVPEQYGGAGLGLTAVSLAIEEASRLCGMSAGDIIMATCVFGIQTLKMFGSKDLKDKLLPELAKGEHIVSFAITEPEAGVNTLAIKTFAKQEGDGFLLKGRKIWITLAHKASIMFVLARTKEQERVNKKTEGLTVLLLEMSKQRNEGIQISRIDDVVMRPLGSCEVVFEDVYVPKENVIGELDKAWSIMPHILNAERISTASIGVGLGKLALSKTVKYAKMRKNFSRTLGSNQGIQFPLAEAHSKIEAAWAVTQRASWEFDSSLDCSVNANVAAYLASQAAFFAADRAMQTFGGMAYAVDSDIERYWRDARLLRTGPVPEEMVLSFIGQKLLHLPRSY